MSIPKPHNDGQWTEARKRSFIMSALRKAMWPPKFAVLRAARTGKAINPKTGRLCMMHLCAHCGTEKPQKEMAVDHIDPVVPVTGFDSWDGVVERLFVEQDGLQALCKTCHKTKTKEENETRKHHKKRV